MKVIFIKRQNSYFLIPSQPSAILFELKITDHLYFSSLHNSQFTNCLSSLCDAFFQLQMYLKFENFGKWDQKMHNISSNCYTKIMDFVFKSLIRTNKRFATIELALLFKKMCIYIYTMSCGVSTVHVHFAAFFSIIFSCFIFYYLYLEDLTFFPN